MRRRGAWALAGALLGCGSGPATATPHVAAATATCAASPAASAATASPSSVPSAPEAGAEAISLARRAEGATGVVVDGDLTEWGELAPDKSHVAVAVSGDRLVFAGQIVGRRGVWIALSFGEPQWMQTGPGPGRGVPIIDFCRGENVALARACDQSVIDREAFIAAQTPRFVRLFYVSETQILSLDASAKKALTGAKLMTRAEPGASTWRFEVDVPLLALPRIANDGTSVELGAAFEPGRAERSAFPGSTITFEPDAERRALALAKPCAFGNIPCVLSYQPGEAGKIERTMYAESGTYGLALEVQAHPLYTEITQVGDVSIGALYTGVPELATRKGTGPLVLHRGLSSGTKPALIVRRDGGALLLDHGSQADGFAGRKRAFFNGCFVDADGKPTCSSDEDNGMSWTSVQITVSPEGDRVTMSGAGAYVDVYHPETETYSPGETKAFTKVWKWDSTTHVFRRVP
ncbi:MAG: hypothetical protein U0414_32120 [Polyangiaceae bacterium]